MSDEIKSDGYENDNRNISGEENKEKAENGAVNAGDNAADTENDVVNAEDNGADTENDADGERKDESLPQQNGDGSQNGGDNQNGGYRCVTYDYGTKEAPRKKGSVGIIFAVCAIVVVMVLLVIAISSVLGRASEVTPTVPETTAEATQTLPNETASEKKQGVSGNIVYASTGNWVNEGSLVTNDAIVNATYHVIDSVVAITTETVSYNSFYGSYVSTGAGSGVIVAEENDESGKAVASLIITNNHVIDGANEDSIKVTLSNGESYSATIIGADALTDIAILKIEATGLSVASFGDSSEIKLGQSVIAIGNPLGELAGTVSSGIISGLEREIKIDGVSMKLIQTDTAINPGNSGGGLFNLNGELIGIVNAKSSGDSIEGLGFAIPINTAKEVAIDLAESGYVTGRCQIGVQGQMVTSSNYSQFTDIYDYIKGFASCNGNKVLEGFYIVDDSSVNYADENGEKFAVGDVISEVGGIKAADASSIAGALGNYEIGEKVTVTVYRLQKTTASSVFGNYDSYKAISVDVEIYVTESHG